MTNRESLKFEKNIRI